MKKTAKPALIAAAFAAVSMASCGGGSGSSTPADNISAPAETTAADTAPAESEYDHSSEMIQTEYEAPVVYDPSAEEQQDVYGPPADYAPGE